jgi:hypothetical protein
MWRPDKGRTYWYVRRCLREIISDAVFSAPSIQIRLDTTLVKLKDEKENSEHRQLLHNIEHNVDAAVDHLIWGMQMHVNGLVAHAVSHLGQRVALDPSTLSPPTACTSDFKLSKLSPELDDYYEGDFGPKRFLSKEWVEDFAASQCFTPRARYNLKTLRTMRMVNIEIGVIDLGILRSLIRRCENARTSDCKPRKPTIHGRKAYNLATDRRPHALLKHYEPIEGWIVAFDGPINLLKYEDVPPSTAEGIEQNNTSIWRRIVSIKNDSREMRKEEVKAQYFPELSVRQFDRHWKIAADELPWISHPGRKTGIS